MIESRFVLFFEDSALQQFRAQILINTI